MLWWIFRVRLASGQVKYDGRPGSCEEEARQLVHRHRGEDAGMWLVSVHADREIAARILATCNGNELRA